MGGSGGQQGSNVQTLRETNLVAGVPTAVTPVESVPKNTSVIGG